MKSKKAKSDYSLLDIFALNMKFYRKAADKKANDYTTPLYLLRAGTLLENEGKLKEAAQMYERIKTDYPTSTEGRSIDKNIARVKAKE